jgi:predicted cupin superfamily sugar epimerase
MMGFEVIENLAIQRDIVPPTGIRVIARVIGGVVAKKSEKVIRIYLGSALAGSIAEHSRVDVKFGIDQDAGKVALHFHPDGQFNLSSASSSSRFLTIGVNSLAGLFATDFPMFERSDLLVSSAGQDDKTIIFDAPEAFFAVED